MGKNNRFYYKGYTAEVEYDFEDKVFVGHLININDTVLFDTEDPNQVEAEFHKTIDEYIDACKDMGLEPDQPEENSQTLKDKKMTKLFSNAEHKRFLKLVKKHRKILGAQVKEASPYDYDALYLFVNFLRFMQEYYVKGDNVCAIENAEHDRAANITRALTEFDLWDQFDWNHREDFQKASEVRADDDLGEREARIHNFFVEAEKEEKEHWDNFWEIIKTEFLYWWD